MASHLSLYSVSAFRQLSSCILCLTSSVLMHSQMPVHVSITLMLRFMPVISYVWITSWLCRVVGLAYPLLVYQKDLLWFLTGLLPLSWIWPPLVCYLLSCLTHGQNSMSIAFLSLFLYLISVLTKLLLATVYIIKQCGKVFYFLGTANCPWLEADLLLVPQSMYLFSKYSATFSL